MSRYPVRPLGVALEISIDEVVVDVEQAYGLAGVFGFGRGLFSRGRLLGADTSYKTMNRLHVGQLVMSRLKAFEGAVAIVPKEFEGAILSPEFPTFSCKDGVADAAYIGYLCRWPMFWSLLRESSKGVGARRERVGSDQLLNIRVPLPAIDEQRRIVGVLDAFSGSLDRISGRYGRNAQSTAALLPAARYHSMSELRLIYPSRPLAHVAEIIMGQSPAGRSSNLVGTGIPLLNGPTEFGVEHPVPRQWTSLPTKITQQGDLLMCVRGATTGRMNWSDQPYCIGRGLAAIRPRQGSPSFLRHALAELAPTIMSKTAGSTFANLPGTRLATLAVVTPPLEVQHDVAAHLDNSERAVRSLIERGNVVRQQVNGLRDSVLNYAFAGLL